MANTGAKCGKSKAYALLSPFLAHFSIGYGQKKSLNVENSINPKTMDMPILIKMRSALSLGGFPVAAS